MCSVYESLGAEVGIRKAVDEFYDRVVADPRLGAYFDGVDMIGLRRHQVDMLSAATGGPEELHRRGDGRRARRTGIDNEAFDRVVGHLQDTLVALGVPRADNHHRAGRAVAAPLGHRDGLRSTRRWGTSIRRG